jgi:hypothetical protein
MLVDFVLLLLVIVFEDDPVCMLCWVTMNDGMNV